MGPADRLAQAILDFLPVAGAFILAFIAFVIGFSFWEAWKKWWR